MGYPDVVLADRPVGYWRMDDLVDSSGHNHPLTLGNAPAKVAAGPIVGDPVHGRILNGSNQYASVALDLTPWSLLTMEAWLIWPAYANNDLIAWAFGSAADRWYLDPNSSGGAGMSAGFIQVDINVGSNNNGASYTRWSTGVWHHVVCTYDRGSGATLGVTMWVDGVQQAVTGGSIAQATGGTFPSSTLFLGSYFGPALYSAASMQEAALYGGVALSRPRILAHYLAGRGQGWTPLGRRRVLR